MLSNLNYSNIKPILLLTPQHSGTYFWEGLLLEHPEVVGRVRLEAAETNQKYLHQVRNEMRGHSGKNGTVVFHSHLFSCGQLMFIMVNHPTVLSLRDPLNSIITYFCRNPVSKINGRSRGVVLLERYNELIKTLDQLGEPDLVLPIDILAKSTVEKRKQSVVDLLKVTGLSLNEKLVNKWATWPTVRSLTRHHHDLKEAYENKDLIYISKKLLKEDWSKFQELKPVLQKFFSKHGYKELIWYDK